MEYFLYEHIRFDFLSHVRLSCFDSIRSGSIRLPLPEHGGEESHTDVHAALRLSEVGRPRVRIKRRATMQNE